jgi:hypothetical protein
MEFALAKLVRQTNPADFAPGIEFLSEAGRVRKFGFSHRAILTHIEPGARYGFKTFRFRDGATFHPRPPP